MNPVNSIDFFMNGEVGGVALSPRTIGLSQFNAFNRQVEDFVAGTQGGLQNETHVEVGEGSYRLRVFLAAASALAVETDLSALAREDSLGEIDPKRAEIVSKWQDLARRGGNTEIGIRADRSDLPVVRLTRTSDYRIGAVIPWVKVEKYLFGVIEDMGGAQKANVHLRLRDTGKTVVVSAAQDVLREQHENRLYHETLLRVQAEQHYKTGQLRNVRLIAFEDYAPGYDEDAMNAFSEQGSRAWQDVPDAVAWVRERRGGF